VCIISLSGWPVAIIILRSYRCLMSKVISKLDDKDKVIRFLVVLCALLIFLVAHAHFAIMSTPKNWTMYSPPDISVGGAMGLNVVPDVVAYNFAYTMWAGVNTWDKDGSKEFPAKLDMYRNYFSPKFITSLKNGAEKNKASNRNRSRTMSFVLDKYSVVSAGNNKFRVKFLVDVIDTLNGYEIKNETIQYSFLIVPFNVSRSVNPWQMRIEGEFERSKRVDRGGL
jgi:hypothetical protein